MAQPGTFPEVVAADLIVAAGVTIGGDAAAKGTNLFHGPVRPFLSGVVPHAAIFCQATGGPVPSTYCNDSEDDRIFTVQIRIRGNVGDGDGALTTARAIWAALQRADPGVAGYYSCIFREPDPVPLGADDQDHPEFINNLLLSYAG